MFLINPTILENGEVYPGDYPYFEENQPSSLEAKTVYLLMQKNVPVSRATRLQWLLDHLNTTIVTPSQKLVSINICISLHVYLRYSQLFYSSLVFHI